MVIPAKYSPELIDAKYKEGWFDWSLDYFTDTKVLQVPYLDITIQLDITDAYALYLASELPGATFFAFLVWHLATTLPAHISFNYRWVESNWYLLKNPPIVIPVAVGGLQRFSGIVLENVAQIPYPEFVAIYRSKLDEARNRNVPMIDNQSYKMAHFMGNLPNLQFTALTLNWRIDDMIGQPFWYFGKRYASGNRLFIPLAVKMHHACADPFVFDLLLNDFQARFTQTDS